MPSLNEIREIDLPTFADFLRHALLKLLQITVKRYVNMFIDMHMMTGWLTVLKKKIQKVIIMDA